MNRKKVVAAVATVAMSGLVGIGLAVTKTAHAGVNGQQLEVCAFNGDYQQVLLEGTNQNGEKTVVSRAFRRTCTTIPDHWWVGPVNVTLTQSASGMEPRGRICDVLKVREETDIVQCRLNSLSVPPGPGN